MQRLAVFGAILLVAVGVTAGPAAAMPAPTHRAISNLVDRFVKDVVLRRDLADGWTLAGPYLTAATTRKAWDAGRGVTVMAFPAIGDDFHNAWTGKLLTPNRALITVDLHSRGPHAEIVSEQADLRKIGGRWIVNTFYPAGIIRLGKGHEGSCGTKSCAISGPNDFAPSSSGASTGVPSSSAVRWLWIVLGSIGAAFVVAIGSVFFFVRRRDRRARAAFEAHFGAS